LASWLRGGVPTYQKSKYIINSRFLSTFGVSGIRGCFLFCLSIMFLVNDDYSPAITLPLDTQYNIHLFRNKLPHNSAHDSFLRVDKKEIPPTQKPCGKSSQTLIKQHNPLLTTMARNYREFKIWPKAYQLVLDLYKLSNIFPSHESSKMRDQLRRAAISTISNIAEGSTRPSSKEFLFFLTYSYGSLKEIDCLLNLAKDLEYIGTKDFDWIIKSLDEVSAGLFLLMRHIEKDTKHTHFQKFKKEAEMASGQVAHPFVATR
jgi:four helix bundle protein